jgi:phage-related protein
MSPTHKPLVWLKDKVTSPPFSKEARIKAGFLLRRLQTGEVLSMPISRPMPSIGIRCHELRISDGEVTWRIIYRIDPDAVIILEAFKKKTSQTPIGIINTCKERIKLYDSGA